LRGEERDAKKKGPHQEGKKKGVVCKALKLKKKKTTEMGVAPSEEPATCQDLKQGRSDRTEGGGLDAFEGRPPQQDVNTENGLQRRGGGVEKSH